MFLADGGGSPGLFWGILGHLSVQTGIFKPHIFLWMPRTLTYTYYINHYQSISFYITISFISLNGVCSFILYHTLLLYPAKQDLMILYAFNSIPQLIGTSCAVLQKWDWEESTGRLIIWPKVVWELLMRHFGNTGEPQAVLLSEQGQGSHRIALTMSANGQTPKQSGN